MSAERDRPDQALSLHVPPIGLNGSAPRCEHLDRLGPVIPRSSGCPACQALGTRWKALRLCLNCGWVACSDDSPERHARAHYQETDHPLTTALDPGTLRRWCYVHQRTV